MKRTRSVQAAIAGALLVLVAGCNSGDGGSTPAANAPGVTEGEILIGTTTALTGVVAANCKPVNDGAIAWFDSINAKGGVNGRKVNNIVLDDGYDAAKALANARELAAKPVLAFFGGCGSIQPPAVLTVTDREDIPYLFPSAGLPNIIANPNLRTLYPLFSDQFRGVMEYIQSQKGPGKTFLINARLAGYEVTRDAMAEGVKAGGGTVVGDETITAGEANMGPLALKIKQAGAEYIAAATNSADGARLFKALKAINALPSKYYVGNSVYLGNAFLGPTGADANGAIVTPANVYPETSPKAKACVDVLTAAGVVADIATLSGCAYAQVLTTALAETKDLNRANLLKTLDGWVNKNASDLLTPITFSDKQHIGLGTMGLLTVDGGKVVEFPGTFKLTIR